uniref:Uncharacterized protein n=1 Tax=Cacopsylla melanoneura TaxID=428564 RepID=A0A8D8ZK19_9HEMI
MGDLWDKGNECQVDLWDMGHECQVDLWYKDGGDLLAWEVLETPLEEKVSLEANHGVGVLEWVVQLLEDTWVDSCHECTQDSQNRCHSDSGTFHHSKHLPP